MYLFEYRKRVYVYVYTNREREPNERDGPTWPPFSKQEQRDIYSNAYVNGYEHEYIRRKSICIYTRRDRPTWPPEYTGRNTSNCVCEFMCTCMHTEKENPY